MTAFSLYNNSCKLWSHMLSVVTNWLIFERDQREMTWFEARIVLNAKLFQTNVSQLYFIMINFPSLLPCTFPLPSVLSKILKDFNATGQKFTLSRMIKWFGFNFLFHGRLKANSSFVIFPSILLIDFVLRKENRRLDWTNKINHHEKELYQANSLIDYFLAIKEKTVQFCVLDWND